MENPVVRSCDRVIVRNPVRKFIERLQQYYQLGNH